MARAPRAMNNRNTTLIQSLSKLQISTLQNYWMQTVIYAPSYWVLQGVQIGGLVTSLYSHSDNAPVLALMRHVDNTSSP
jgi:hypothetical protein